MIVEIKPTEKQHLAWQALQDDSVLYVGFGGGAGSGKSWCMCEWLLTLAYLFPGMKAFIGRNELKRLMGSTYLTFVKVCAHHNIPQTDWKLNGQYNYIEFTNGSRIDLLDLKYLPSDPLYERFGSLEYTVGAIEEAGEVDFRAFDVLKSRVGRHKNEILNLKSKVLLTFNPKQGWLYQVIYKPWRDGSLPKEWRFIQALYQDNPYTAKEYGENLSQIQDTALRERLMNGNWEYSEEPTALIPYNAITDLFIVDVDEDTKRYITCDVARFGADKTVIGIWEGLKVTDIQEYAKLSTVDVATKLRTLAQNHVVPYHNIVVDEDGVGGGVVDSLAGCYGFMGASAPLDNPTTFKQENYQNLRAQCYYKLAEYVNARKISVKFDGLTVVQRQTISEELAVVRAKDADKDGRLKIEPKESVKELLGRSPDYADMLMMRMVFELKPSASAVAQIKYSPNISGGAKIYYPRLP